MWPNCCFVIVPHSGTQVKEAQFYSKSGFSPWDSDNKNGDKSHVHTDVGHRLTQNIGSNRHKHTKRHQCGITNWERRTWLRTSSNWRHVVAIWRVGNHTGGFACIVVVVLDEWRVRLHNSPILNEGYFWYLHFLGYLSGGDQSHKTS